MAQPHFIITHLYVGYPSNKPFNVYNILGNDVISL